jgi:MFS family permease
LIITFFGSLGVLIGGWLNDKLSEAGYRDAPVRLAAAIFVVAMPIMLSTPLIADRDVAIALLALAMFVISMQQALSPVALQSITPNEMRAQIISLFILVASFSSISFGASSVAVMTDYVFKGDEHINRSLAAVSGVTMTAAAVFLMLSAKPFRRSAERAARLWSEN